MKNIVKELLQIDHAIGYTGEPIKIGGVYYSVGNNYWRYKVIDIVDRHNVTYQIIHVRVAHEWKDYTGQEVVKNTQSCVFSTQNLFDNFYPYTGF